MPYHEGERERERERGREVAFNSGFLEYMPLIFHIEHSVNGSVEISLVILLSFNLPWSMM